MARAGLYLSDVRGARDSLRAQGKHPSIDAVRIALGNTGSKTTIHKLLRQLEEEDGEAEPLNVSGALQSFVEQLAVQLQRETGDTLERERVQMAGVAAQQAKAVEAAEARLAAAERQIAQLHAELEQERSSLRATTQELQEERIARHTAEQRAEDLQIRLDENEAHRVSLEEKHRHAREALEHFRQAALDQRDRESRSHEAQMQHLRSELRGAQLEAAGKHDEVSRLNLEAARIVSELASAQRALYAEQQTARSLEIKLDQMRGFESQCMALTAQLEERKEWQALFEKQLERMRQDRESMHLAMITAQVALEQSKAQLASLQATSDARQEEN